VPVGDILAGLLGAPGGVTGAHGVGLTDLTGQSAITNAVSIFTTAAGRNDNGTSTTPKAYINWILFDNNFKYVAGNFSRVGAANAVKDHYTLDPSLQNIQVTKNGYLYVYVENESPVNVFFDNLQVIHTHGALVEESHYYPFGLTMEGISDKAIKGQYAGNKYKYNGKELQNKEFSDGTGLEEYDYGARFMDPQIGQWRNVDPHATKYANASPYQLYGK
jgi:RHS repeat-associated protein